MQIMFYKTSMNVIRLQKNHFRQICHFFIHVILWLSWWILKFSCQKKIAFKTSAVSGSELKSQTPECFMYPPDIPSFLYVTEIIMIINYMYSC